MSKLPTEWNLTPLASGDDNDFSEERKTIEQAIKAFAQKWKANNAYLNDPTLLREALDEYETLAQKYAKLGKEGYYFSLRIKQDQGSSFLRAKHARVEEVAKKLSNELRFFGLQLARIPESAQKEMLVSQDLQKYRHFLTRTFARAKHDLSEAEEKIMALKATSAHDKWVRMVSTFLANEEHEVLVNSSKKERRPLAEIISLLSSRKKEVRDDAARVFNTILDKHGDVAENEINAILTNKRISDELRNYQRPDSRRHLTDDIETEVVDTLVKTVASRFDIAQKYYALKAQLLGVKSLKYHERGVPYGNLTTTYTYEDAVALITKTLEKLDSKFASIFTTFIHQGQIDVFPRKGKMSGAICMHHLVSTPTYILLNHTNKIKDVLTIAHEFGHGANNELIREKQHALYFETPISTAEVASTFMEDFVYQALEKEADDETKLALMMMKLGDEVSTIFRQIACYQFEQELHTAHTKKGYLSKEEIGAIFQKHMEAYMGPSVDQPKEAQNWWVYWSHIRRFFYVYSYASGLLISKALQRSVKQDPKFIEKVKEFLSAGTSDSPKNLFLKLGIDISKKAFWEQGLNEVETLLSETEALAKKLGKI